jgi:hypothetical protein
MFMPSAIADQVSETLIGLRKQRVHAKADAVAKIRLPKR